MRIVKCLIIILLIGNYGVFAQNDSDLFTRAGNHYIKSENNIALQVIDFGLQKNPGDERLLKLKKLIEEEEKQKDQNKDQENKGKNQENKDQENKDQKDQDKKDGKDQENKEGDQKKDEKSKDQQDEKKDGSGKDQKQKEAEKKKQQEARKGKMSKEEAEKLLKAMMQKEQMLQDKNAKKGKGQPIRIEKEW